MVHKAWSSIEEVPYCFWRSPVKFLRHTALKIVEFDPDWGFPDCISSLNSPMATKWCTKLPVAEKRCPIVFWRSPVKFLHHTALKSSNLTQIGRFWTIGRSQLSNPSDLPCSNFDPVLCCHMDSLDHNELTISLLWVNLENVVYCLIEII